MFAKSFEILLLLSSITHIIDSYTDFEDANKNVSQFISKTLEKLKTPPKQKKDYKDWSFKDYMRKFSPVIVKDRIDKLKKSKKLSMNETETAFAIIDAIDETDELLKLKILPGNPKKYEESARKYWRPTGKINKDMFDPRRDVYSLKPRLYDLMQMHIYQIRGKMGIMQTMRDKYKTSSLYKMGYLFSKTDQTAKTFASLAYKGFKACGAAKQMVFKKFPIHEQTEAQERLLNLWFDVDQLVDLIRINDGNCKDMMLKVVNERNKAWSFVD